MLCSFQTICRRACIRNDPGHAVDPRRLRDALLAQRANATSALSARETELYKRAVAEASRALIPIATELRGYQSLRDAALLEGQEDSNEREERILAVEALLRQPDEAGARFEELYPKAIEDRLDKLELFGVRRLTAAMKRQRLNVAYVTVQVEGAGPRELGNEADHVLNQALAEAARTQMAADQERGQSGPIDEVLASARRIVVRGDPGSGKTTLLQWIAVNAAARRFRGALELWNNVIPFFVRLRDVAAHSFPAPEEYVGRIEPDIAGRCPDDWAHLQLENGRAVLLIDGVDELPAGKREAFLERLQSLLRLYPRARYLVTSRPAAVSESNWPEWHEWVRENGFAEVAIKEMSPAASDTFIEQCWRSCLSSSNYISDPMRGGTHRRNENVGGFFLRGYPSNSPIFTLVFMRLRRTLVHENRPLAVLS
jgi:hypothetical protein